MSPAVPVVTIDAPARAVPLARALVAGGVLAIEITLRTGAALEAVRAIAAEVPQAIPGVGTVLTPAIEQRLRNEMQRDGSTLEAVEARFLEARQPSRRFVDDANVAALIGFLCGPHSADINGAALPIDGGWIAGR